MWFVYAVICCLAKRGVPITVPITITITMSITVQCFFQFERRRDSGWLAGDHYLHNAGSAAILQLSLYIA